MSRPSSRQGQQFPAHPNSRPASRTSSRGSGGSGGCGVLGHGGSRPGSRSSGSRRNSDAETIAQVEMAKATRQHMAEKQQAIEFLIAANQDYERILATTNIHRDNVTHFADGARAILASMRLKKNPAEGDSLAINNAKDVFKEVLQQNMNSQILKPNKQQEETKEVYNNNIMRSKYTGRRLMPPLRTGVRRKPKSIEPMPDRVKQRVVDKLLLQQAGGMSAGPALPKISNKLSGELNSRGLITMKKKKDLLVVTGPVNYQSLLDEQRELKEETDKKEVLYKSIMKNFDSLQETFHRRFSLLEKQEGSILNIDGGGVMKPLSAATGGAGGLTQQQLIDHQLAQDTTPPPLIA